MPLFPVALAQVGGSAENSASVWLAASKTGPCTMWLGPDAAHLVAGLRRDNNAVRYFRKTSHPVFSSAIGVKSETKPNRPTFACTIADTNRHATARRQTIRQWNRHMSAGQQWNQGQLHQHFRRFVVALCRMVSGRGRQLHSGNFAPNFLNLFLRPFAIMSRAMAWAVNNDDRKRWISSSVRGHSRRSRASIAN